MTVKQVKNNTVVEGVLMLSLSDTLDCGQAFRWEECEDGCWQGIAHGRYLKIALQNGVLTLFDTNVEEFNSVWCRYFDLERDYCEIVAQFSKDNTLNKASKFASGIRVLRQEPWETLCSFIISQNNNIPRIKGIINRLCESFGQPLGEGRYSFPSAKVIASLSLEDLAPLRSGFRAKYILDAAKKVASGEIELEKISQMDSDTARAELTKIYGVGEKVADCTLLFGMGHIDALPKDVWIKRVLSTVYKGGLPDYVLPYAGIAQQYLFHYARMNKGEIG